MTETVDVVGVVGAGFMGSGIAQSAAAAGKRVILHEPTSEPLDRSRAALEEALARSVEKGRLSRDDADATAARITYTTELAELAGAGAVIEAVFEDRDVKQGLFARLDDALPGAAFLASNTSSIRIEELAQATARPERVVGLHFFSPVPVMKLVEIVASPQTAPETIAAAENLAREIGKDPVRGPDRAGFIVNALLIPYLADAIRMLEAGLASAEDIDTGMTLGCGHPMGPLALCDFIGLDVVEAVCVTLHEELGEARYAPPELLRSLVAKGRLGRKSGHGFYDHAGGPR
ncbi:MAG TPA: 3-hydroxybutyryl-CoA dehydrogenase [Solirubrobacteraceae bacterium]|nr:3-hydroxybutyryl-CoA dehydrogenase [Solirubrobacteraceae bacterium]